MVGLIGISHQTALLEIREQLVISKDDITELYKHLNVQCGVKGILTLSTCNRTELYFEADSTDVNDCDHFTEEVTNSYIAFYKKNKSIKKYFYTHTGLDCARHLFRVATGLDSLILGEYQIVSQLKEAFSWVDKTAMAGPEITRMVHKAFEAGKEVRTKTSLNKGAVSVSSAAVELIGTKLKGLSKIRSLTVGAGETGSIVAINLAKKGCNHNMIANRTLHKAEHLASRVKGEVIPFESYTDQLHSVDVVVYTTGAQKALLTIELTERVMQLRDHKPLMVIDLCNPRNVASDVSGIDGISLYDLDHMEDVVKANFEKRKGKVVEAEKIIEKVLGEFDDWLNQRRMSSAITSVSNILKEINYNEALNYKKVKDDAEASKKIAEYGEHLSSKFSRIIIKQMKAVTNEGRDIEKVKLLEDFFNFNS